jgi:putative tricarboxylic transport membrane protein
MQPASGKRGLIRAQKDFVMGIVLVGFMLFVFWALGDLPTGTLQSVGPALLPRALATGIGLCGAILLVGSFIVRGESLEPWSIRGPVLILAAIFAFALTIRSVGLLVAGPLAMIIGGLATPEARLREIVLFAVIVTLFCAGLFRYALNLAIPILSIPGLIHL